MKIISNDVFYTHRSAFFFYPSSSNKYNVAIVTDFLIASAQSLTNPIIPQRSKRSSFVAAHPEQHSYPRQTLPHKVDLGVVSAVTGHLSWTARRSRPTHQVIQRRRQKHTTQILRWGSSCLWQRGSCGVIIYGHSRTSITMHARRGWLREGNRRFWLRDGLRRGRIRPWEKKGTYGKGKDSGDSRGSYINVSLLRDNWPLPTESLPEKGRNVRKVPPFATPANLPNRVHRS